MIVTSNELDVRGDVLPAFGLYAQHRISSSRNRQFKILDEVEP
jgi:hypothetical protein